MIARTICFPNPGELTASYGHLVWYGDNGVVRNAPIEDLGFIILESQRIKITTALMRQLADNNVAVIVCDDSHMPSAQLLSVAANTTTAESAESQLAASEAVNGRIWRQICRAKIFNQAQLMHRLGYEESRDLFRLVDDVKNGDPANCEAQAARKYFQTLGPEGFKRERDGEWPNAPLNYGYALLRAAAARALVGSGLVCFKGVHHHNRYNAFALADDVMEPYRPFVDQYVLGKVPPFDVPSQTMTKEMKAKLMEVLTCDVKIGDVRRPLMNALSLTTASLVRYFKKETGKLSLPELQ